MLQYRDDLLQAQKDGLITATNDYDSLNILHGITSLLFLSDLFCLLLLVIYIYIYVNPMELERETIETVNRSDLPKVEHNSYED